MVYGIWNTVYGITVYGILYCYFFKLKKIEINFLHFTD